MLFSEKTLFCIEKNEESSLQVQQAISCYRDQHHEQAFKIFLQALENVKEGTERSLSQKEKDLAEEALKLYLDPHAKTVQEHSELMLAKFAPTLEAHPEFHLLGFFVASAYANLGYFEKFFSLFYSSYLDYPRHFLAYKIKAILNIKLFERTPVGEGREELRAEIMRHLKIALELAPSDTGMYKTVIAFAPPQEKRAQLVANLNKIIDENIIIPRTDILFYVQELVAAGEAKLADKFVRKAKEWYPVSRIVVQAEECLRLKK